VHQCHQPQPWESLDIELLKQLTTQVEIAIQQSELYQQAQNELSERKLAELKIQEQVALLDIATDAISVRDLENRILFWNKGAERLYGWLAEEAVGKSATDLITSENSTQPDTIMPIVIQLGAWQGELQKKTKDGRELLVESRWTLVRDESGQPKSFLVVNTDITEKKQLEQQAFRTQRLEDV
jgi:PAS domain S-box-containing protein